MSLCPECRSESRVIDTRLDSRGWRWRRRVCNGCNERFNTYELPAVHLTITEPEPEDDAD